MPTLQSTQGHKGRSAWGCCMSFFKVTLYAIAMTICAISAGVSTAVYVMGSATSTVAAKPLPKPTPNCPDCQDANAPLASVKE